MFTQWDIHNKRALACFGKKQMNTINLSFFMEASTRAQPYITSVSTYNIDNHIHQTIEIRVAEVGISKRGGGGLMVMDC